MINHQLKYFKSRRYRRDKKSKSQAKSWPVSVCVSWLSSMFGQIRRWDQTKREGLETCRPIEAFIVPVVAGNERYSYSLLVRSSHLWNMNIWHLTESILHFNEISALPPSSSTSSCHLEPFLIQCCWSEIWDLLCNYYNITLPDSSLLTYYRHWVPLLPTSPPPWYRQVLPQFLVDVGKSNPDLKCWIFLFRLNT